MEGTKAALKRMADRLSAVAKEENLVMLCGVSLGK